MKMRNVSLPPSHRTSPPPPPTPLFSISPFLLVSQSVMDLLLPFRCQLMFFIPTEAYTSKKCLWLNSMSSSLSMTQRLSPPLPPLPSLSWAHFICIHACLGLHLLFTFIPLFSHIVSAIIPPSLPRRHLDSRQLSAADVLTSVCVFSGHCVVMVTQHTQVCGLPHKRSTKLN